MNKWKEIWEKRDINKNIIENGDTKDILIELKRLNGHDVYGEKIEFDSYFKQNQQIQNLLSFSKNNEVHNLTSIYEVGCGSGANLYLFEKAGIYTGGIDYSDTLICCAKKVLNTEDLSCDEAINMSEKEQYDSVVSMGVFSYFIDEVYASNVLEKMYNKSRYSIGITAIHNIEKKKNYIEYRKATIKDYEEKYKGLPKLFFSKQFFLKFAEEHDMDIMFVYSNLDNYWNNEFVYDCYMYKNNI